MCLRHDDAHLTTTVMLIGCFVNTNLVNDVARWVSGVGDRGKLPSIVRPELWVTQGAKCLKATYKTLPNKIDSESGIAHRFMPTWLYATMAYIHQHSKEVNIVASGHYQRCREGSTSEG